MIDPKDCTFPNAKTAFGKMLDAIPPKRRPALMREMMVVEGTLGQAYRYLEMLRKYFLDTNGEASPFVKKIDELMPRPKEEPKPEEPKTNG